MNNAHLDAKLHISGAFECRDKDGKLLKTIKLSATVPLRDFVAKPGKPQRKRDFPLSGFEVTT